MKKTLKLMLAFALVALSSTSAWAAELVNSTQYDTDGYQYVIKSMAKVSGTWTGTVSVKKNTFSGTTITIKDDVSITVEGTVSGVECKGPVTFTVVEVEANGFADVTSAEAITIGKNVKKIDTGAFSGCTNVTSITFADNTNDIEIEANAFKGTKPVELDLTPIKGTLDKVNKWFDNAAFAVGTEDVKNNTLVTIKFPAKVNTIVADAFAGFSKLKNVVFAEQASPYVGLTMNTGAFQETAIVDLDLTNARITQLEKLFEDDNVTLKTVKMAKTVVTLNTDALANCIQLNSVDFSKSTVLTTLKAGSLSNTVVSSYDFTNCYTLNTIGTAYTSFLNFTVGENPFVNATTKTNKNLTTVILPKADALAWSPVNYIGTVFANCEVLTTITNLNVSKITTVHDYAFANDISLTALSFPATVTSVGDQYYNATAEGAPFAGCTKLASLTFAGAGSVQLGDGTHALFGAATQEALKPVAAAAAYKALTTLTITGNYAGTIKAASLVATGTEESALTTLSISAPEGATVYTFAGSIEANAIELSADADATVTIGKIDAATFNTIAGPLGTNTTALTLGDYTYATLTTNPIVSGTISKATVGAIAQANVLDAIGQAKEIKFAGDITPALAAPTNANAVLTTLDFGNAENDDAIAISATIPATVFNEANAPLLTEVTWKPADADITSATVKPFDKNTFNTSTTVLGSAAYVTFHTTTKVGDGMYSLEEANLIAVIFDATAAAAEPVTFNVYGTATSTYFYGKMKSNKKLAIAKTDEETGDQIEVYSAFVDSEDQAIYMDRLSLDDGEYVVKANEAVIIRVKNPSATTAHPTIDGGKVAVVKAYQTDKYNTMRYVPQGGGSYRLINDLKETNKIFSSDYIGTNYVGKTLYAMANPAKVGELVFDPVAKTSYLPKGALFVETEETASSANLRVVWLDGSDDATAILDIIENNKVNNDAIYNLQGVRVDASYKGIVIKNGKKMLQK